MLKARFSRSIASLALALLPLIIGGCVESVKQQEAFKPLVLAYTENLSQVFLSQDLKGFGDTLTASHYNRLDHRLMGLKKAGIRMDSHLRHIDFLQFNNSGKKMLGFPRFSVATRERWDVKHIDKKTGKVLRNIQGLVYDLRYDFEQHDGKWQIDAVEVLKEKKSE